MSDPSPSSAAPAPSNAPAPEPERAARRTLALAAAITAAGVALSGTVDRGLGGAVVVVGWVLFAFALHAVGRAGSRR